MNEEYKPITNLWKDFEGYRYFGTLKLSSKIKYDGDDFIPLWEWVKQLQQENKQLKELIDTILNWVIFKNECPMNFGYDEETNENKAQDVFYKDDDYCENNCNDDYTKCWLKYFKRMHELEKENSNE